MTEVLYIYEYVTYVCSVSHTYMLPGQAQCIW